MRLILAGGGNAVNSRPLDVRFAEWVGPYGRLLYLPIALPEGHPLLPGCEAWLRSVFAPLGLTAIDTWHAGVLTGQGVEQLASQLHRFDGVYIGGGNTYLLLHLLRLSGLDRALTAYAQAGGSIFGGSAGAVVLGGDIRISELVGDANEIGLTDTSGLGLVPDCDILPHYESGLDARIAAHVSDRRRAVIALSERAGMVIEGDEWLDIGYEPSRIFSVG